MIIEHLYLNAFGRFKDQHLDFSAQPCRFHLVFGPNESGKTTSLRAIGDLLFGIPNSTIDNYLHPNAKMRVGATLLTADGSRLSFLRRKARKDPLRDLDDNAVVAPEQLERVLGGISREAFFNQFGLTYEALRQGGEEVKRSEGHLGEILFAAGAGVSQMSEIASQLTSDLKGIFVPNGKKPPVNELISTLRRTASELRDQAVPTRRFNELQQAIEEATEQAEEFSQQHRSLEKQRKRNQAIVEALAIINEWDEVCRQLDELKGVKELDADFAPKSQATQLELKNSQDRLQADKDRMDQKQQDRQSCHFDQAVIDQSEPIEKLYGEFTLRNQRQADVEQSEAKLQQLAADLVQQLTGLQIPARQPDDVAALLTQADQLTVTIARNELTDRVRSHQADWQAQQKAETDHREATRHMEDCQLQLTETPDDQGGLRLDIVLREIGASAVLLDSESERLQRCQSVTSQCQKLLRQLNLPQFSVSEVVKLPLPTDEQVQSLESQIKDSEKRLQQERLKLEGSQARQEEVRLQLDELRRESQIPTQQDLQSARQERDETVNGLVTVAADQLVPAVDQVRQKINSADVVIDRMRADQEAVTTCSMLQDDLDDLAKKIQEQQQCVDRAIETADQVTKKWDALWSERSIDAQSPAKMKQWLGTFADLLSKHDELQSAEQEHQAVLRQIQDATLRLTDVIEASEANQQPGESGDPDRIRQQFQVIYDQAQEQNAVLSEIRDQRKTRQAALRQAEADLTKKRQDLDQANRGWKQWQQGWHEALDALAVGLSDAAQAAIGALKPEAMLQHLEQRDFVQSTAEQIRSTQQAIANLQLQVQHYDQQVTKLAGLLLGQAEQPVSELIRALKSSLDQSLEQQRRSKVLDQEIKQLEQALAKGSDEVREGTNQLEALCKQAEVAGPDDLDKVARQAQQKRKAIDSRDQLRRHLQSLAADLSVDEFVQHVHAADVDQVRASIDQLADEMELLKPQKDRALEERGARLTERDAIQGDRGAADLKQDYELQLSKLRDLTADYAKLSIAQRLLKQTLEHYRSEHQSPILALACSAFAKLTEGRYQGLVPGEDSKGNPVLYGHRGGDDEWVPMGKMSVGTADAVFLALRIASIEHQLGSGVVMPVVIDDCLVQLDDQRAGAALQVLADLATQTQVILFTHHQHLLDLAGSTLNADQFHTHVL